MKSTDKILPSSDSETPDTDYLFCQTVVYMFIQLDGVIFNLIYKLNKYHAELVDLKKNLSKVVPVISLYNIRTLVQAKNRVLVQIYFP